METTAQVQDEVRQKYGSAARAVAQTGSVQACCDPGLRCCDPITTNLYSADEKGLIPRRPFWRPWGVAIPLHLSS